MADNKIDLTFNFNDVEILQRETLYQGFFKMERVQYKHRNFGGGWSPPVSRELMHRGDAVGVLLYDPKHDLVGLVEQIRPGALNDSESPWCLEVVAGMIEPDESIEGVAWRELKEEAGLTPAALEHICQYRPSPGGCDERLYLYCGVVDLLGVDGEIHGLEHESEDIRLTTLPADVVFANLYCGRFDNAATLIGLQWLQMNRDRLREDVD